MDSGIMVFIILLAIHNLSIDKYLEYAKYRLSDEEQQFLDDLTLTTNLYHSFKQQEQFLETFLLRYDVMSMKKKMLKKKDIFFKGILFFLVLILHLCTLIHL